MDQILDPVLMLRVWKAWAEDSTRKTGTRTSKTVWVCHYKLLFYFQSYTKERWFQIQCVVLPAHLCENISHVHKQQILKKIIHHTVKGECVCLSRALYLKLLNNNLIKLKFKWKSKKRHYGFLACASTLTLSCICPNCMSPEQVIQAPQIITCIHK